MSPQATPNPDGLASLVLHRRDTPVALGGVAEIGYRAEGRLPATGESAVCGRFAAFPGEGVCQSELQVRKGTHPPRFTARQRDSPRLSSNVQTARSWV
jgi:hypothetical protein